MCIDCGRAIHYCACPTLKPTPQAQMFGAISLEPWATINAGDYITGIDRSYERSIYKVLSIDLSHTRPRADVLLIAYFGQLGGPKEVYTVYLDEYRLASQSEIDRAKAGPECECGNKHNPVGQGHSSWCKRYRKEF